jgi:hypothetical protein
MQTIPKPPMNEGETYAGLIGNANGEAYHLILLPGDNDRASFEAQLEWAKSIGGDLPDRVEQALLFKHFKPEFQEAGYWSNTVCEPDEDEDEEESSWAWYQGFNDGYQDGNRKSYGLRARAVRRLPI